MTNTVNKNSVNPTKIVTGVCRLSYANIWQAKSINGGSPKFSTSVLIPKSDTKTIAKVKAAIFAEPGLKTLQISVDTIKGVVTLSGSVDSQADSDQAKGLASAVSGVNEVDNRLALKAN